ncbi:MAG: 1-acyl-sn-glycerol-3-phosphate acyltransferase [Roseburia sp.]|nr:1-acyl-sn-glycerol-3-phosphate acyltransferase [Roseburia sp.]
MKIWFMFWRCLLFLFAKICFPFKVMDKQKYKKYARGQIIITNHLSWMDVPYLYYCTPGFKRLLSKKENAGGKFRRAALESIGIIFVNREKPELSSMRECLNALKDGQTLSIFPEGTRNRVNREIGPMHSGAAMFALKGNASVIPIVVHHKGKFFKRNYLGVGDPVPLDDLFGKRVDENVMQEATDRFRAGMQKTLDKLDKWVEEKGYKREKKLQRAEAKKLKSQYKAAKSDYAKSSRCE